MRHSISAMTWREWLSLFFAAVLVVLLSRAADAQDELVYKLDNYAYNNHPNAEAAWFGWSDKGNSFLCEPPGDLVFTVDYLVRQVMDSRTCYEFGTPPGFPLGDYAPLSRLDWPLNSTWRRRPPTAPGRTA